MESILARGGRSFLILSMSSYPLSVSMMTSEPLFQTHPDAPTFDAERYTVGLKPTPWTVPRIRILMAVISSFTLKKEDGLSAIPLAIAFNQSRLYRC